MGLRSRSWAPCPLKQVFDPVAFSLPYNLPCTSLPPALLLHHCYTSLSPAFWKNLPWLTQVRRLKMAGETAEFADWFHFGFEPMCLKQTLDIEDGATGPGP